MGKASGRLSLRWLVGLVVVAATGVQVYAQITQVEFGRSRVQYQPFEWQYIEAPTADIYFYPGGQNLAFWAYDHLEEVISQVERVLEFRDRRKVLLIIYNTPQELRQSNIGRGHEFYNPGGVTRIIGDKLFVAFSGDYTHFERQLREGIARIYLNRYFFSGGVQDIIQNALLLNLPSWVVEGLVKYIGEGWTAEDDLRLREWFYRRRRITLHWLVHREPVVAGKSFWFFIDEKMGEQLSVVLRAIKANKGIEGALIFVMGKTFSQVDREWEQFFRERYSPNNNPNSRDTFLLRLPGGWQLTCWHMDVKGRFVIYAVQKMGRWRVYLLDRERDRRRRLLAGGVRTVEYPPDPTLPLVAVSPQGLNAVIVYNRRNELLVRKVDLESREVEEHKLEYFQKVHDIGFYQDDRTLLLSAVQAGRTNVFSFNLASHRFVRETARQRDALYPRWVEVRGWRGWLFWESDSASRTLWYQSAGGHKQIKVAQVPVRAQMFAAQLDSAHFVFGVNDGVRHVLYRGYLDSVLVRYDTLVYLFDSVMVNPGYPPEVYQNVPNGWMDSFRVKPVFVDTAYVWEWRELPAQVGWCMGVGRQVACVVGWAPRPAIHVGVEGVPLSAGEKPSPFPQQELPTQQGDSLIGEGLYFLVREKPLAPPVVSVRSAPPSTSNVPQQESIRPRAYPYLPKLSTDYVVSQLDNSTLITPYIPYESTILSYPSTALSPLLSLSVSDLFENYRFFGGVRSAFSLDAVEWFVGYENVKNRVDWRLTYYYQLASQRLEDLPIFFPIILKIRSHYLEGRAIYPFSEVSSLRLAGGVRYQRFYFEATEPITLFDTIASRFYYSVWPYVRLEWVFDNTVPLHVNMRWGVRTKVWVEGWRQLDSVVWRSLVVYPRQASALVVGCDVRGYTPLWKGLIVAGRLAGGFSTGGRRVIFILGGVDSWLNISFREGTPQRTDLVYGYVSPVTNMRGFPLNVRNGDAYLVGNGEVRWAPFYSFRLFPNSNFFQSFQLVGFLDVGSAWYGLSPYSEANPINRGFVSNGAVSMQLRLRRNPWVVGYGGGARFMFLGYFVRLDLAYPLEDYALGRVGLIVSLSMDF